MEVYNTLTPYYDIPYQGIAYGHCREFSHICRYQALRQVTHNAEDQADRFIALETPNPFTTNCAVKYYTVPAHEENRLDVIAYKLLGSAQYSWVLSYFNKIEDGFTCRECQKLVYPESISSLYQNHEILASVSALSLNLGTE